MTGVVLAYLLFLAGIVVLLALLTLFELSDKD